MAQPPAYSRVFSFTDWTANNPSTPQPGVRLDVEYDAIALTLTATRANLALIQRDDGALRNASVGPDQLSPELTLGLRSVGNWATDTDYVPNDAVWYENKLYRVDVGHTSAASFATDLAAERLSLLLDIAPYAQAAAEVAVTEEVLEGIEIDVDLGPINVALAGKASLADPNTFAAAQTFNALATFAISPNVAVGAATALGTYFTAKPTDFGAGKPGVFLRKKATANAWELALDDGAAGSGTLDIAATALTVGGVAVATSTDLTAFQTAIRRVKHLALAF